MSIQSSLKNIRYSYRGIVARSIVFIVGYILSPLTWWNDLFVNIPIAYVIASILTVFIGRELFAELFALAYMFTNVLGFILMHLGATGVKTSRKKLLIDIIAGIAYTILVYMLARIGFIQAL